MIPVVVFICTNIITKSVLKYIAWDVIWLVAGGIALGYASKKTGLASHMVHSLPCEIFARYLVLASAMLLSLVIANFMPRIRQRPTCCCPHGGLLRPA